MTQATEAVPQHADQPHAADPNSWETLPEFVVDVGRFDRTSVMPEVRELSRVSNWRSGLTIAWLWAIVIGAGWLAIWSGQWWMYILAALVIGTRQQAMGVMVHDATHYLLFTNRFANDILSDLFLGFPLGIGTTLYRETHFRHHRYTSTEDDPDWVFQQNDPDWQWPKSRLGAAVLFARCVFGVNLFRAASVYMTWSPGAHLFKPVSRAFPMSARILFVVTTPIIWFVLIYFHLLVPAILIWLLPSLTLFNLTNRARATAEHIGTESTHELNATRTVLPNLLERIFIAPLGISYHVEHHLFPSVPGCQLAKLHRRLMEQRDYASRVHLTRGYAGWGHGVLYELMRLGQKK